MMEPKTTLSAAETVAQTTSETLDSATQTGSTPGPDGMADAIPAADGSVEHWREKARHFEAEAKKAFDARDKIRHSFFESDEGQRYKSELSKAKQDLAEFHKAQSERAEKEAVEKGEFKTLYESTKQQVDLAKSEIDALRGKYATEAESWKIKLDGMQKEQADKSVRAELALGYARLGGIDPETFQELVTKQIASGDVKLDESGKVVGVEEVLKQFRSSKGYLFGAAPDIGPGGLGAGAKPKHTGLGVPSLFSGPHTQRG